MPGRARTAVPTTGGRDRHGLTAPAGAPAQTRDGPDAATGADTDGGELERSIGLFQLSTIGIGATIGTGIFFVLSQAVPLAGPAVVWSFVVAGVVAGLTAVCYAELTSAVPVSGSSYSYAYATLGEVVAMGVAACLLLEYGVSAAAVAVGWSEYLNRGCPGVSLPGESVRPGVRTTQVRLVIRASAARRSSP
jgi:amino acid transporter